MIVKQGRDGRQVELLLKQDEDADGDDRVVHHRHHAARREAQVEAEGDVHHDEGDGVEQGLDGRVAELLARLGADPLHAAGLFGAALARDPRRAGGRPRRPRRPAAPRSDGPRTGRTGSHRERGRPRWRAPSRSCGSTLSPRRKRDLVAAGRDVHVVEGDVAEGRRDGRLDRLASARRGAPRPPGRGRCTRRLEPGR